ncbi:hypothetical protein [Pseudactinotalea sp.]|uniref:hypothetical protein n=1 Tax=Pseudactinotalea sp. TaxID=1926260 RepID=UPI003B3A9A2D
MTETPSGLPAQPQPAAPATVAPESGRDRLIRGLKTAGIGLLLVIAGIAVMVYMGSQGLTGTAAFGALALVLVGAFFLIKGVVLAIWGAIARSRG